MGVALTGDEHSPDEPVRLVRTNTTTSPNVTFS